MNHEPRDVVNPLVIDTVMEKSATVLTSPDMPGQIIVKAQFKMPPDPSLKTLLLPLDPDNARQLHAALTACIEGTSH